MKVETGRDRLDLVDLSRGGNEANPGQALDGGMAPRQSRKLSCHAMHSRAAAGQRQSRSG